VQEQKLGYSLIEFISTCPTNWGLTPIAAMDFLKEKMLPYYPLGVFKSPDCL
jgi:2-oxoglutarate ferredoxin oxidoreductase subunit beta